MPKNVTYEFEDISDILDTLDDTISALKGFHNLLNPFLSEAGGYLKCDAYGIGLLLDQQMYDLEQVHEAVRVEVQKIKTSKLEIKDPELLAKLTGLPVRTVKNVIWATYGIDADPFTDTVLKDGDFLYEVFRRKLRDARMLENARGTVSEWSGVSKEDVDKVLHAVDEAVTEFMFRCHKSDRSPEEIAANAALLNASKQKAPEAAPPTVTETEIWEETCKEAGIADLHFHDLRGTTVTMLFQAGCSLGEIVAVTGHSLRRAQDILDKYLARTSTMADSAIAKFENVLETDFAKRPAKQEASNEGK